MDLRLTDEQQQLTSALAALYGKHASPERVRAAEPGGFDKTLWEQLLELGVVRMAVAENAGGWGASPLDLALAAEQQGRAVAPAPVIEAQVAARLLARLDADELGGVLDGARLATVALHRAIDGRATVVPAAAVADDAVVLDGDDLRLVPLDGARTSFENLGSAPLADVVVSRSARVLASGEAAITAHDAAVDDWLCLSASALVGVAARALELGVDYVKERKAWGQPIGAFQSVAHGLADVATAVDGSRLLALEAAWAATEDIERAPELAALAFGFASESARDATDRSLHYHGGYGFMMEYDVQLYWRRARAWSAVWGEPRKAYQRAADHRYGKAG